MERSTVQSCLAAPAVLSRSRSNRFAICIAHARQTSRIIEPIQAKKAMSIYFSCARDAAQINWRIAWTKIKHVHQMRNAVATHSPPHEKIKAPFRIH
jgi:hypothetical protein